MRGPARSDVLIALGLLAAVATEQVASIGVGAGADLLKVPGCLALVWRRVAPVSACLAAVTLLGVGEWFEEDASDAIGAFAGMLLAMFSLMAHARREHLVGGAIAAAVLLSASSARQSINNAAPGEAWLSAGAAGALFSLVILCAPAFAIGWAARRQADLRRRLEEQAHSLELERELHAAQAVDAERERMAADLHQIVTDGVRAMLTELGDARRDALAEPGRAAGAVLRVEERGRDALTEMRSLLGVLRRGDEDLALAPQPSLARLDALARHAGAGGLEVTLRVEGAPRPLTPGLDVAAYRLVEEALASAAGAGRADVVVRWDERDLALEVGVDGPQLAEPQTLRATRERVALFDGRLEAGRRPRGGSVVIAQLPIGVPA